MNPLTIFLNSVRAAFFQLTGSRRAAENKINAADHTAAATKVVNPCEGILDCEKESAVLTWTIKT